MGVSVGNHRQSERNTRLALTRTTKGDGKMSDIEAQQTAQFDYSQLDTATTLFLQRKEQNMREIVGKAYTELGRELYEAQQELSKNGYGCFREWCDSIGMKKDAVNRLIRRYNLIVANCDEQKELIEDLPVSLTYEIAKPSAESTPEKAQAKSEVLAGEIDTLKEYRARIAELEAKAKRAESDKEAAEKRAERAQQLVEEKEFEVQELRHTAEYKAILGV